MRLLISVLLKAGVMEKTTWLLRHVINMHSTNISIVYLTNKHLTGVKSEYYQEKKPKPKKTTKKRRKKIK